MFNTDFTTLINNFYQLIWSFLPKLTLALATLILGFWAIRRLSKSIKRALLRTGSDATVNRFLASMASISLKVMLVLSVASLFGIQTASFIAVFTALAFSLGTALSGNIGHFASGLMILIFRPYRVGDEITVQNYTGIVTDIQVFHTTLLTSDNRKFIMPNGVITSGVITNYSHKNLLRMNIIVTIADEADFAKAKALILQVADECPIAVKEPQCKVLINNFNKNGIEIYVRPWCTTADASSINFYFQEHIRDAFLAHGIPAPISAYDVNVKNV